ncbi:MAG: thioesterase [Alicyclobacillus macrosporangiidus]|uniref:thioesterase family protein n=1 Tax=Alicyclobacillus macrosporangiidus TaxID=392015 RepID=UPI0026E97F66|nr:thioesterase [Alicyclobacillus macrosporangiidus]MCL6600016.1 thioesterase [Alicyclobacillus macrosporangiidus]
MKPGLRVGHVEAWEVTVTEDMCPAFEGKVVHRTMSTVTMVYYMEWVARLTILPYLEAGEEGIGGGVSVRHLAPAPVGKVVRFYAEVTACTDHRVDCRAWAEHDKARIGEGKVVQYILPKARIEARIAAMS